MGSAHFPLSSKYREECGNARLLELLHMLCKTCPDRVRKYLVQYRASFILKRLHKSVGSPVHRLILKLMKKQVRHLPRKWKQTNMKILSACYLQVAMSPLEDWLLSEPRGEAGPDAASVVQDSKASSAMRTMQGSTRPRPYHGDLAKAPQVLRRHLDQMHSDVSLGRPHPEDCLGYLHAFPEFAALD
ncbi:fam40 [Symbiodinium pilosum]|uniref:Fam40 protein n=1 Tax=Symbiodinium pilosum TaxID=2952 RepID=A0A812WQ02_SYMPI|nr:fam40 [Symbiodinium pilosum]